MIDNQASMFFSRGTQENGQFQPDIIILHYIHVFFSADLESTQIFTLETMFGCMYMYLQDLIFFSCVPVGVELPTCKM